jgi:hypothetical protein
MNYSGVYLRPRNPIKGGPTILEFPYTPQIDYSNEVKYDSFNLTHTNYQPYAYARTENPQLTMNCKFSSHTKEHFNISENAIRFLRTYTKMNYGRDDVDRGQSPRILRFFAMGNPIFYNVPVVISRFNVTFPEDVDYIKGQVGAGDNKNIATNIENVGSRRGPSNAAQSGPPTAAQPGPGVIVVNDALQTTSTAGNFVYLPAFFQISITLLVQQNIARTVKEFTLSDFASGRMSKDGYI